MAPPPTSSWRRRSRRSGWGSWQRRGARAGAELSVAAVPFRKRAVDRKDARLDVAAPPRQRGEESGITRPRKPDRPRAYLPWQAVASRLGRRRGWVQVGELEQRVIVAGHFTQLPAPCNLASNVSVVLGGGVIGNPDRHNVARLIPGRSLTRGVALSHRRPSLHRMHLRRHGATHPTREAGVRR